MNPMTLGGEAQMAPETGPTMSPAVQPMSGAPAPMNSDLMAQYGKLKQAGETLQSVREGLDKLVALKDTVTTEDVVREAGILVAKGLEPVAVAGLLAEMPETPEQLAEWVMSHDQQVRQREQQLAQVTGQVQHKLGTSALRSLLANSMSGGSDAGL